MDIATRKAQDQTRKRLRELDQIDNGSRLYEWTLATYQEDEDMGKRGPKAKANIAATQLSEALAFVAVAGTKDYKHVWLEGNEACMTDGQLFAGYPIAEELKCCPHLAQLRAAINKCGKSLSITELDSGRLSVKGEKLRALIPCIDAETLPDIEPDPIGGACDDTLKEAFKVCGVLASESGTTALEASLLLESNVCTSTNRRIMMQYWHGLPMPPEQLVIPKIFTQAVARQTLKIVGLGWNPGHSITVHFENGAWLKTVLYGDRWPDINGILNGQAVPKDIPEGMFEACDAIEEFNEGHVYFAENAIWSHGTDKLGAQFEVKGLQAGKHVKTEEMKLWLPFANQWDYTNSDKIYFFGERVRGCTTTFVGE